MTAASRFDTENKPGHLTPVLRGRFSLHFVLTLSGDERKWRQTQAGVLSGLKGESARGPASAAAAGAAGRARARTARYLWASGARRAAGARQPLIAAGGRRRRRRRGSGYGGPAAARSAEDRPRGGVAGEGSSGGRGRGGGGWGSGRGGGEGRSRVGRAGALGSGMGDRGAVGGREKGGSLKSR